MLLAKLPVLPIPHKRGVDEPVTIGNPFFPVFVPENRIFFAVRDCDLQKIPLPLLLIKVKSQNVMVSLTSNNLKLETTAANHRPI